MLYLTQNQIVGLLAISTGMVVTFSAAQAEFIDRDTARRGMHACPVGSYMTGADRGRNYLLCDDKAPGYKPADEVVDTSTVVQGMHACPDGTALTGWEDSKNLFLCAPINGFSSSFVDTSTVRKGMHACPVGMVMKGLQSSRNRFLCGYKQ